ncbi:CPBP family intramembrane metalloprotease [Enterococcus faecalis]|uniref:CPBP family intramembrane metalloprotease n=1 Tax=Enterococcus faecalis TaxID=1351 RepID=A0A974S6E4_ENTFL|nr:CPBP family intramembrane metalloprotease [Enterococcus faecalis]
MLKKLSKPFLKGLYLFFCRCDWAQFFEEGIFFVSGFKRFFQASFKKIGILVSSILFALVHTPTDIGSFVIYWGMGLAFKLGLSTHGSL